MTDESADAVERIMAIECEHGGYHEVYGMFHGGDPRLFKPDEEDNTPEELAAHKAACEAWERGEGVDRGPACATMGDGSIYDGTGFGMGVSTYPCDADEQRRLAITAEITAAYERGRVEALASMPCEMNRLLFNGDIQDCETIRIRPAPSAVSIITIEPWWCRSCSARLLAESQQPREEER